MTQTSNRIFDEFARLMNDAAGVASGVRREEFEAVKEMARLAREQNELHEARIAALEAKLAAQAWPPVTQPDRPGQSPGGPTQPPTM